MIRIGGFVGHICCLVAVAMPHSIAAQEKRVDEARTPSAFNNVLACRQITIEAERLACFDRSVAAFEDARQRQQVAVIDNEDVREARRSLFGLSLPRIRLLEGSGMEEREDTYAGTIRSVRMVRGDRWVVQIDDAVWQTTESGYFQSPPRVGQQAVVTRGPLGSFRMSIEGRAGLKATRVR